MAWELWDRCRIGAWADDRGRTLGSVDIRWIVSGFVVLGFLVAFGGLVAAFCGAGGQLADEKHRVSRLEALATEERTAYSAIQPGETAERARVIEESVRKFALEGGVRPSNGNLPYQGALEAARVIQLVLNSSRAGLGWAAVGLLLASGASVWSLWIVA